MDPYWYRFMWKELIWWELNGVVNNNPEKSGTHEIGSAAPIERLGDTLILLS